MTTSANITDAVEILADEVTVICKKISSRHEATIARKERAVEHITESIARSKNAYNQWLFAYSMLFGVDMLKLERMALDSMGLEHISTVEELWAKAINW